MVGIHHRSEQDERLAAYLGPRLGALVDDPEAMARAINEVVQPAHEVTKEDIEEAILPWARRAIDAHPHTWPYTIVQPLSADEWHTLDARLHVPLVRLVQARNWMSGTATIAVFLLAAAVLFFVLLFMARGEAAAANQKVDSALPSLRQCLEDLETMERSGDKFVACDRQLDQCLFYQASLEERYAVCASQFNQTRAALANATADAQRCERRLSRCEHMFDYFPAVLAAMRDCVTDLFTLTGLVLGKFFEGYMLFLYEIGVEIPGRIIQGLMK